MPTWAPGASRAPSSVVERHSRTLQVPHCAISRAVRKEKQIGESGGKPLDRRQRRLRADLHLVHLCPVVPRALLLLLHVPLDATGCDQQHPRRHEGDESERQVPPSLI